METRHFLSTENLFLLKMSNALNKYVTGDIALSQ